MDYNQLVAPQSTVGSIARWVNSSIIQGDTPEIVTEAESWIYRRLRHWKMLTAPTYGTFTAGQDFITNPGDMLEPFVLFTTGNYFQNMEQRTPQEVLSNWSYNGNGTRVQQQPMMFYFDQVAMRFDSPPDQAYGYALVYYQQPVALSVSITNFLTATYPRLVRCACMAAASEWMKDSGQGNYDRTYWDTAAQDEIDKAQAESDRARRGTTAGMVLIGGGGGNFLGGYANGWAG